MGKFINALDDKESTIRLQWVFIAILSVALMLAIWGLQTAPKDISLHIPPDLRSGATLRPGEVPAPNVYAFAHYIWQQVNHWSRDGDKDYGAAVFRMQSYLTPACRETLERDLATRASRGELALRTRALQEVAGHEYRESSVTPLGAGAWRAVVDFEVKETVRGLPVKDTAVRYPLRVVRFDVDREKNPFGLALDCFMENETPMRLVLAHDDVATTAVAHPASGGDPAGDDPATATIH